MGEMADWATEQALLAEYDEMNPEYDEDIDYVYGYDPMHGRVFRTHHITRESAEKEMEEFVMPKTYSIDVNSEKKVYRVKPPEARGSFMQQILVPEAYKEGDEPEWSCQLRWPMDNDEVKAWAGEMAEMFKQILVDKFGAQKAAQALQNPQLKIPLRNGNHEENEEYHGWLFMNVRNKFRQPIIMGPHAKAIPPDLLNDSVIYSGAWYRSRLVFRYFDVKSKGIGSYIEILMKTRDDERLDNVINVDAAEGEFSEFASEDAGMDAIEKPEEASGKDDGFDFL